MMATAETTTITADRGFDSRHGFETGRITAPVWLTGIWIALFIIRPWEVLIPQLATIRFERLYVLTVLSVVLASGSFRFRGCMQTYAVILFIAALALSSLFAFDASIAWGEFYKYLTLAVFYFVLLSVIRTPYQLQFIIVCYIVAMAAYLAKAEWEYFIHNRHDFKMGVRRLLGIEGTFGGPNSVASSTVLSLPFLQFLWWRRHEISRSWSRFLRRWFPLFLLLYLLLAITAIVLTNSRSGAVGFAVFVVFFGAIQPHSRNRLRRIIASILALLVVWIFIPEATKGRVTTIWNPAAGPESAKGSADGRKESFWAGVTMFSRSPITGVGIGNTARYRGTFIDGKYVSPHSFYGEILGETGVIGTAAFIILLASLFANIRATKAYARMWPFPTTIVLSDIARTCGYVIVLLLVSGLAGDGLLRFQWLWLAGFALLARNLSETAIRDEMESQNPIDDDLNP
jgi:O-antigen ligase